ncbi:MAG: DNA polymerase III subunit gamma/tau [Actinomycetota bacterium]
MAHTSLYRRFRPQRFDEIVGQEHVVSALRNAVAEDRVGHAYLFSGPRGTGKTSSARILAKALNCENLVDGEPCGVCDSCVAIREGTSLDVHELDAASNNGVNEIRDLVGSAALGTPGRTKVYVLDEVHMLSKAASNALLKTLEEPPGHVVFVLATTDPQKVLPTIRSRTQHFEFRLLTADELEGHVRQVADEAGIPLEEGAVDQVVRRGAGSARDTLSALDQVAAGGSVADPDAPVAALVGALADRDPAQAVRAVADAMGAGVDPRDLAEALGRHLRDVFLVVVGGDAGAIPAAHRELLEADGARLGAGTIVRALETIGSSLVDLRQANDARLTFEVALLRLTADPLADELADVRARLERLEAGGVTSADAASKGAAAPTPPPSAAPAPPPPPPSRSTGQGPAAAARAKLAERGRPAAGAPAAPPAPASAPPPPPSSAPAPAPEPAPAPAPEPAPAAPPPEPAAPEPSPAPAPAAASGDLDVAGLQERWETTLLGLLSGKAKAYYGAGRFAAVDGHSAAFALPNGPHMARCESVRRDVEAMLGDQLGHPLSLVLMVDGDPVPPLGAVDDLPSSGASEPAVDDEVVDPDELIDADDASVDPIGRIQDAFPGAELVDDLIEEDRP